MTGSAGARRSASTGLLDAVRSFWPSRQKVAPAAAATPAGRDARDSRLQAFFMGKGQPGVDSIEVLVKPVAGECDHSPAAKPGFSESGGDRSRGGEGRRLGSSESAQMCFGPRSSPCKNGGRDPDLCTLSLPLSLSTKATSCSSRLSGSGISSMDSLSLLSTGSARSVRSSKVSRVHPAAGARAGCRQREGQARSHRPHFDAGRSAQHLPEIERRSWSLDDLDVFKTIGMGFMGSVRMVKPAGGHNPTPFALKVMQKEKVIDKKQEVHVMQERVLLGRVNHPFVVKLVATFQDSAHLFMLMEYVNGGELFSMLRTCSKLKRDAAKFFAAEVTLAIGHLHSMDIAYRDLKPENILLDSQGHVKLVDFGFAKVVTRLTWTKCGTAEYMAPEIIASAGHGTPVDWWALGILIFEMLCGASPFMAASTQEVYDKVLCAEPKYPAHFTNNAKVIIGRLLTKNISHRLGCGDGGVEEVKQQAWFANVDWEMIYQRRCAPPFVPGVKSDSDTSFYDNFPEVAIQSDAAKGVSAVQDRYFEGF